MNNEILEISKWLHEKGFEADMWVHNDLEQTEIENQQNAFVISNVKVIDHTYGEYNDSKSDTPYFTLNRVLELLPRRIENFYLQFNKAWEHLAYVKHESATEITYHKCQVTWIGEQETDYHLAALRLLKKTVEEGYVKAT